MLQIHNKGLLFLYKFHWGKLYDVISYFGQFYNLCSNSNKHNSTRCEKQWQNWLKTTTILYNTKVHQLVEYKHRMVEIPFIATVGDTLNTLLVKNILAMHVATPHGIWPWIGGNKILEQDRVTVAIRKKYIGMVSVLDVLIHVAEAEEEEDMDKRLAATVDSIAIDSMQEHTIWCISPHTSHVSYQFLNLINKLWIYMSLKHKASICL